MLMACWIVYTIKTTRSLHKPHNIFVANMMITDIITAVLTTIPPRMMIVGYATGVRDFIICRLMQFLILLVFVLYCTYLMISVDQAIAVALPFKHRKTMKLCVLSVLLQLLGSCLFFFILKRSLMLATLKLRSMVFVFHFLGFILPNYIVSLITLCFNIFLAIKAYHVQRKIQEESKLSRMTSNEVNKLKKQATIKTHVKPMITLQLVILCSSALGLIYPLV